MQSQFKTQERLLFSRNLQANSKIATEMQANKNSQNKLEKNKMREFTKL
jgi:hypothetical protein